MHKPSALCTLSLGLLLIGGLNWGLVGLGALIGGTNLNIVNLLLGRWPIVESIVYLLVGLAAVKVLVLMAMGRDCGINCKTEM